jgi:hypothetical protein
MKAKDAAGDWANVGPCELQILLAELGVKLTLEEAEILRQLLVTAESPETAWELLAVVSKAA